MTPKEYRILETAIKCMEYLLVGEDERVSRHNLLILLKTFVDEENSYPRVVSVPCSEDEKDDKSN